MDKETTERPYEQWSRAGLAQLANSRNLLPNGTTGPKGAAWRATASKKALILALRASDTGTTITPESSTDPGDLGTTLAAALLPSIREALADTPELRDLVSREIQKVRQSFDPTVLIFPDQREVEAGRQHPLFVTLTKMLQARLNVWLAGPAGSGKTTSVEHAAQALGLSFGALSIGPQTTQSQVFGFIDATGNYRSTVFRRIFEQGGVMLLDEIDRGNPGVLTSLNQALANGTCAFPDGMVDRHPDCIFVAAGNTWGTGANRQYVGALQIDAATLDRFVMLEWPYDEAFEMDLAMSIGDPITTKSWVTWVQNVRSEINKHAIRHIVSPRASINGAKLLAAGLTLPEVKELVVWRGLDIDTRNKIGIS